MPSPVVDLLADLTAATDEAGLDWYLFGAQAAILHGVARLTADVDVTVRLPAAMPTQSLVDVLQLGLLTVWTLPSGSSGN